MSKDQLPTYEAVIQNVTSYASVFGQNAEAEKLLGAHSSGTLDFNAKENQNPLDFSFLSKEENEKLTLEIAKLLSSDQGKAIMRTVAHRINKDIKDIRDMFFTMYRRLKDLDDKGQSGVKFHDRFEDIQRAFTTAIDNSRELAQHIAAYAEDFEDLILPVYEDSSIPVDRKKELIQDYINQAAEHAEKSKKQKEEFETLLSNFNKFIGDFKDFAKDEQTTLEAEIKKAEGELLELQVRLATALSNAQKSLGAGLAAGAIGAVFLGLLFPPALGAILIGGAVVAGLGAATAAGFTAYAHSLQTDVTNKEAEIKTKNEKLGDLKKVRQDLIRMGADDFQLLKKSLDSIIMVWDSAKRDAGDVMDALQKGLKVADLPLGLKIQLNKSVASYKSVALYLRGYARGSTGE